MSKNINSTHGENASNLAETLHRQFPIINSTVQLTVTKATRICACACMEEISTQHSVLDNDISFN